MGSDKQEINRNANSQPTSWECLLSFPLLQQCEEAGNGPMTEFMKHPIDDSRAAGLPARLRTIQWRQFKNRKTHDIAAIMQQALNLPNAETFDELCGNDYLALIYACGNGFGKAFQVRAKQESWLRQEAEIERFYLSTRITLRRALKQAVDKLFGDVYRQGLQILMLSGDDLLIACRAPMALKLVNYLAQALVEIQKDTKSAYPRLTIGVGVAIAKPAFPFYRLHDLAEELASSAKRLVRDMETPVSVVDWTICSESWYGDLQDNRRSSQWVEYSVGEDVESLALSAKPYRVLSGGEDNMTSLAELVESVENAGKILEEGAQTSARSQLKDLLRHLRKGRRQADFAFQRMEFNSPVPWAMLQDAGFKETIWRKMEQVPNYWLTHYPDWLEILEIPRLKTEKNR